ncbi:MAG: ComEC/Rec2 family competence protein, partial [Chloroflexota bacterium]|nr:ComEC/Rec2 family competence protein [Chloroflexota bacterium]
LRHRLGAAISRTLPDPEASTLAATLLGLRSAMDKRQQQALVETGTVHLVVISGFKLSLLAMALQALALWCLRRVTPSRAIRAAATLVVLSAVAGYVVLSGATPSSLRAALMAGMVIAADLTGRPRDRMTALAVAVLAILLFNPFDLWDGGFQLSCLSVLGITLLAEPIAGGVVSLLRRWRRPTVDLPAIRRQDASHPFGWMSSALAEAAGASVAATLFDLPVLANSFHLVSLVSPLANLLGMPLLSPIMAFGMVGAGLGAMLLPLGAPFLWLAWAFTRALEWVVAATDAIPHAALPIGGMPWWLAGAYYALLLWLSWELARRRPENRRATSGAMPGPARWGLGAAVALAAAAGAIVAGRPDGALRVTFLAVPGEAALIQTPSGRNVLINGGRSGIELERQLGQLLAPWDRTIDLAIATTTRSDGVTGLVELANRYRVRRVVGPQPDKTSLTFARFERSAPRLQVAPGQAIELGGGARLEPVDAGSLAAAGSPASGEQPWRLSLGGRSILFADRLAPAPANLPDAIVEAVQRPAGGQIWIRPIGSGAGERDDEAIDLAEAGNVTVRLRPSAAPFAEP